MNELATGLRFARSSLKEITRGIRQLRLIKDFDGGNIIQTKSKLARKNSPENLGRERGQHHSMGLVFLDANRLERLLYHRLRT